MAKQHINDNPTKMLEISSSNIFAEPSSLIEQTKTKSRNDKISQETPWFKDKRRKKNKTLNKTGREDDGFDKHENGLQ